jgi:alpha-D-ribose 1-methylphosphonate 5-triphosphate synthase subunit PhnG
MKDNCKNRKLTYIRTKNGLRLGRRRYYWFAKVSQEFFDDVQFNWNTFITKAQAELMREYGLKLVHSKMDTGLNGDDFVKNLMTIRVTLHN